MIRQIKLKIKLLFPLVRLPDEATTIVRLVLQASSYMPLTAGLNILQYSSLKLDGNKLSSIKQKMTTQKHFASLTSLFHRKKLFKNLLAVYCVCQATSSVVIDYNSLASSAESRDLKTARACF